MASWVVWEGPSVLNGSPIALVAVFGSANSKTGDVVQTYIIDARNALAWSVHSGSDASVCGMCPHRRHPVTGERSCYVSLATGANVVSREYLSGRVPAMRPEELRAILRARKSVLRLGTYGDPAAVPQSVWEEIIPAQIGRLEIDVVGYTHQWDNPMMSYLRKYCMASCETEMGVYAARTLGWRTFRARRHDEPVMAGEIVCPASAEAGRKLTCAKCRLCGGTNRRAAKDVAIIRHDATARAEQRRSTALAMLP